MDNLLCLDKSSDCPINYIKIDKDPPPGIKNIKTLKGNDDINIFYSNNPYENSSKIPYIQSKFKIGEDEICTAPHLYYTNLNLFKLDGFLKYKANKCVLNDYTQDFTKYKGETVYHSLDIVNNYQLYKENNIIDKINNTNLVKFGYNIEMYKDINLHLYVRRHYGFNKTCLENRKKKDKDILTQLKLMNGIADKMKDWSQKMKYEIGSFIASILDLISFTNLASSESSYSLIESLIKMVLNFGFNVFSLISSKKALKYDDPCEEEMECSDNYTNDNYNIMILKLRKSGKNIENSYYVIIVFFVLLVLAFLLRILIEVVNNKETKKIKKYKYKINELNNKVLELQEKLIKAEEAVEKKDENNKVSESQVKLIKAEEAVENKDENNKVSESQVKPIKGKEAVDNKDVNKSNEGG